MVVESVRIMKSPRWGIAAGDGGQSILEFLLMLPMMIGLVVILIKVNTTIQISINNQQYGRAHTLWMAFNSPVYPTLVLRERELTKKKYNQMILGVSENAPPPGEAYVPKAATHYIARKRGMPEGAAHEEPPERSLVRVRNTVTLCTQSNVVTSEGGLVPLLKLQKVGESAFRADGMYSLGEGGSSNVFNYCAAPEVAYKIGDES